MGDILSGLESMGLGNLSNVDLFNDKKDKPKKEAEVKPVEKKLEEKDFLYDRDVTCECCGHRFKEKSLRPNRMKPLSQDVDLRPKYEELDTLKYSVSACPICGYAALSKEFSHLSQAQSRMIKDKISSNFTGLRYDGDIYTYDDAIARCKLALINTVVKHGKISERAYLCLTLGWLTRGKAENLEIENEAERAKITEQLSNEENDYLTKAAEGFGEALMKEAFPICGMNDSTFIYLMSALNFEIGKYPESLKYVEKIILNKAINERIKEKARKIKEAIQEIKNA